MLRSIRVVAQVNGDGRHSRQIRGSHHRPDPRIRQIGIAACLLLQIGEVCTGGVVDHRVDAIVPGLGHVDALQRSLPVRIVSIGRLQHIEHHHILGVGVLLALIPELVGVRACRRSGRLVLVCQAVLVPDQLTEACLGLGHRIKLRGAGYVHHVFGRALRVPVAVQIVKVVMVLSGREILCTVIRAAAHKAAAQRVIGRQVLHVGPVVINVLPCVVQVKVHFKTGVHLRAAFDQVLRVLRRPHMDLHHGSAGAPPVLGHGYRIGTACSSARPTNISPCRNGCCIHRGSDRQQVIENTLPLFLDQTELLDLVA